jgi:hypothetical protein
MKMQWPRRSRWQRIRVLAFSGCAAAWLCASAGLCAAQEPATTSFPELTLEQYRAELDRYTEAIQRPSEIPQLDKALPPFWTVRSREKQLQVPTEPIHLQLQKLRVQGGNPEEAAHEMRLLVNALKQEAEEMDRAAGSVSAARAHTILDNILNRKEFRSARAGPGPFEILLAKISRWAVEMLARLFSRLHVSARTGNIIVWSIISLAFLALCYMTWRWLSSLSPSGAAVPAIAIAPSDVREWVSEALAAAQRGDYRTALHCAYWGAVARLEDLGRLSRDRARTPRESLRLLESQSGDHRSFRALTGGFERVWYGYRTASEADWTSAKEVLEKIGCLEASTAPTANS